VSAGEIGLAQLQTGATFRGFRVNTLGGNDQINASGAGLGLGVTGLQYVLRANGGTGNDALTGGNLADLLFGEAGNDTLNADRRDVLAGGNGGTGNDTPNIPGPPPAGPAPFNLPHTHTQTLHR